MLFYLKEEFLSFDHFDIWDENENLVYSADREFFNFGKSSSCATPPGSRLPPYSTCRFRCRVPMR